MNRLVPFAALAAALALPAFASAQEAAEPSPESAPSPENVDATRQAREHFLAGIEQFRNHQYRQAIQSFELARRLVPSADLQYNIGRAHEELSEYDQAIERYQAYLRDRVDPPDRAQLEAHIASLRERASAERARARTRPTTGTLRLTANRDGADVELDGARAGTTPWDAPREVEAGRHALRVSREGYIPFRADVGVERGVTTAAYADLVPETRYRAERNDPIFCWIVWGLGVGALGASIGLGVEAASRQSVSLDDARTLAAFSDGLLGATIGLAIGGAILWFVEGQTVGTARVTVDEDEVGRVRGP
ncbi:MAG: PEGA domain-containing protein [Sandaracinaceae bacterium]|nr:PEGA domain-containing protein [Sandaracinaceae bacterium]